MSEVLYFLISAWIGQQWLQDNVCFNLSNFLQYSFVLLLFYHLVLVKLIKQSQDESLNRMSD